MSIITKVEFCKQCPKSLVVPDPDPHDWFCDDDESILCTLIPADETDKSYAGVQYPHKIISCSNRPYQTGKVKVPVWCPQSIDKIRKEKLEEIGE